MVKSLDGSSPPSLAFMDAQTVQTLDALLARTVAAAPDGFFKVWMCVGLERGRVAQVDVHPVIGESIRFPDRGRRY